MAIYDDLLEGATAQSHSLVKHATKEGQTAAVEDAQREFALLPPEKVLAYIVCTIVEATNSAGEEGTQHNVLMGGSSEEQKLMVAHVLKTVMDNAMQIAEGEGK